jgi:hypothetical protein
MFFDAADLDSEDEEEIMEEFMMAHSEQVLIFCMQSCAAFAPIPNPKLRQVAKKKWRCTLDGREFSTLNIMRAHFQKRYDKLKLNDHCNPLC